MVDSSDKTSGCSSFCFKQAINLPSLLFGARLNYIAERINRNCGHIMESTSSTSSAELIDSRELDDAQELAREAALKEAGEKELPVSDVRELERGHFYAILTGPAAGSDGASADGSLEELPVELQNEVEQRVGEDARDRTRAIAATPDAHVFKRTDEKVGYQDDSSRKVGIADDVLTDPKAATRISKHEGEHRRQDKGDDVMKLPETGDPEIDGNREGIRRLVFREDKAIKAEGGLSDHTAEYREYVSTSKAVARYLDESGQNGERIVEEAGDTAEGFRELQAAMVVAAVKKRIKEQAPMAMAA